MTKPTPPTPSSRTSPPRHERVSAHVPIGLLIASLSLAGCMMAKESAPTSAQSESKTVATTGALADNKEARPEAEGAADEERDDRARHAPRAGPAAAAPAAPAPAPIELAGEAAARGAAGGQAEKVRPRKKKRARGPLRVRSKPESRSSGPRRDGNLKGATRGDDVSGFGLNEVDADEAERRVVGKDGGRAQAKIRAKPELKFMAKQDKTVAAAAKPKADGDTTAGASRLRVDGEAMARPTEFLPRMCYFENTYLGGNAAYRERLRRLSKDLSGADNAWLKARAAVAEIDPPNHAAIGLSATLDQRSLETGRRVWLQIGLRGSRRYGWRRPPLDVSVVVTRDALHDTATRVRAHDTIRQLVRRLGPQDRIEVRLVHTAGGLVVQPPINATELRHRLPALIDAIDAARVPPTPSRYDLRTSLAAAGASLVALSDNPHRVPGTRLVLLVTGTGDRTAARLAERAAHDLQLRGAVTSVLAVAAASDQAGWWRVANAGHGNFHRVAEASAATAVQTELDTLSRVVARLLRLNVRLGRHANAVRILGSKVLKQREVARVKAREKRIDKALSTSMGLAADRGDDDDGIQTVIPYFYGDDAHVLLIELWVDKPGVVADITLRYKDLVNLDNATERISVALSAGPRPPTPAQLEVVRNVRATRLALSLGDAWQATRSGDNFLAIPALQQAEKAAKNAEDRALVRGLRKLVLDNRHAPAARQRAVRDALRMARDRKVGDAGL